ncbi:MAG: hypothetical protein WBH28_12845 [Fuerstiella sp.]
MSRFLIAAVFGCGVLLMFPMGDIGIRAQELDAKSRVANVTFCAMGDVPYTDADDILLPIHIKGLPAEAEFTVHVGDIKGGATACDEAVYVKVAEMLSAAVAPVFVIPGDNEWNDCIDPDPHQAWQYWEKHFIRFDRRWKHQLPVFRQLEREENFSFVKNNVLFVGLNIVGGRVHDAAEWKQRHTECLTWIRRNLSRFGSQVSSMVILGHAKPAAKHDDFFNPFQDDATQFKKPILYLHGDGHSWIHDHPFAAKNILRVQVDQGGKAQPVRITVTEHPAEPFVFER